MKKLMFCLLAGAFLMPACAQQNSAQPAAEPSASAAAEKAAAAPNPAERAKMLYSLGFLLGDNLKNQLVLDNDDDYKAVSQGMRDSLLGKEAQTDLQAYKGQIMEKYKQDAQLINQRRQTEQTAFLEKFAKEKGVKVLDNGAMLKLSKSGKGRTPKADSTVTVHYEGKLMNGTKFDSSYDRGEPFTTKLSNVIPCWTKGLQYMRPHAKGTLVCPPDTAYGNRPIGAIPANSVLIFEVELLEIVQ